MVTEEPWNWLLQWVKLTLKSKSLLITSEVTEVENIVLRRKKNGKEQSKNDISIENRWKIICLHIIKDIQKKYLCYVNYNMLLKDHKFEGVTGFEKDGIKIF